MTARRSSRRTRTLDPRSARALGLIALTAALCAPLLALSRHADSKAARSAALAEHARVTAQARSYLDLAGKAAAGDTGPPGSGAAAERGTGTDLVARLRSAMRASGVPESALREARQAEPVALRGDQALSRLSGSATIASVTPADAARLVARWRSDEPAWTIATITLRASRDPGNQSTRTTSRIEDRFDLDLIFEALAPTTGITPGITPGPGAASERPAAGAVAGRVTSGSYSSISDRTIHLAPREAP